VAEKSGKAAIVVVAAVRLGLVSQTPERVRTKYANKSPALEIVRELKQVGK